MQLSQNPDEEHKKQDQPELQPDPEGQARRDKLNAELIGLILGSAEKYLASQQAGAQTQGEEPKMQEPSSKGGLPILKPGYIRQIIDFSPSTYKALQELAGGSSIGEALRDAIALSKLYTDLIRDGDKIYVKRKGKLHEVVKI